MPETLLMFAIAFPDFIRAAHTKTPGIARRFL
jgi:hypothetical protein